MLLLVMSTKSSPVATFTKARTAVMTPRSLAPKYANHIRRHGEISDYHGQSYKWHQVTSGVWRGIAPDDWNDAIQIQADQLDFVKHEPLSMPTLRSSADLLSLSSNHSALGRRQIPSMCQFIKDCALLALQNSPFNLGSVIDAFLDVGQQVLQLGKQYGPSLWKFLNQPLVIALPVGVGTAALGGAVSAWTSASIEDSECSKGSKRASDADIIKNIVNELGSAQRYRSISAKIQIGDVTATITMEAVPSGQLADEGCGPPSRNLIADGTNIVDETKTPKELIAIEGLTPEAFQNSTSALANIDGTANHEEPSAGSTTSASDLVTISRKDVRVISTLSLGQITKAFLASIAASIQVLIILAASASKDATRQFGEQLSHSIGIYLGKLSLKVSARNGDRLTWGGVLACVQYLAYYANQGVLVEFSTTIFVVSVSMLAIFPDGRVTTGRDGLRINVTEIGDVGSTTTDTGKKIGRRGFTDSGNT